MTLKCIIEPKYMKKFLLAALAAFLCVSVFANETPRWLRQNAISPDGNTVAFVYQGDIWLVPASGGEAKQLTTNPAHDTEPRWSPDGKYVIFASYREGQKDLWAVSVEGGRPKRLTDYGGAQTPYAVSKDGKIFFSAYYQELASSSAFPGANNLYCIDFAEALTAEPDKLPVPTRVATVKTWAADINADGTIIYEDYVTPEDPYRKHHTSSAAHNIWKLQNGTYTRLTTFIGEDKCPVFAPDGIHYYYLSEQSETPVQPNGWAGDANVWKSDINGAAPVRVTSFTKNPVRYLSISGNGILCYSWNGDLYTQKEGQQPVKLAISIDKDKFLREHTYRVANSGVNGFAVSPTGKEIAVVSRGDVFVTPLELGDTRRITNTPEAERGVAFSKDGRTLYYASERNGEWAVYKSSLTDKKDQLFTFTTKFKEERVTPEGEVCFQPSVSPDGKWLAYLRNRTGLVICPANGGKEKVLLPEGVNYSYSDGDLHFEWSPDSRYILSIYQGEGRMYNEDILRALIDRSQDMIEREMIYEGHAPELMNTKELAASLDRLRERLEVLKDTALEDNGQAAAIAEDVSMQSARWYTKAVFLSLKDRYSKLDASSRDIILSYLFDMMFNGRRSVRKAAAQAAGELIAAFCQEDINVWSDFLHKALFIKKGESERARGLSEDPLRTVFLCVYNSVREDSKKAVLASYASYFKSTRWDTWTCMRLISGIFTIPVGQWGAMQKGNIGGFIRYFLRREDGEVRASCEFLLSIWIDQGWKPSEDFIKKKA